MKRLIDEQRLSQLQLDAKEISLPPRKEKGEYGPVVHSGRDSKPYPSYAAVRNDYEEVRGNGQGVELRTESRHINIRDDNGYQGSQEDEGKGASPILNESKKVISPLNIVSKNGKFTFNSEQSQHSKSKGSKNETASLQDKIVLLEQREIKKDQELEERQMSLKHKEIQLSHDAKQLKQQITYLRQQLDEKDKELLSKHNEMQDVKL